MPASFAFALADNSGGTVDAVNCVGTTLAGSPVLPGFVNVLTTSAGQVAATLPQNWPVGSPLIVRVSTATAGTIFPPTAAGAINGASAGAAFSVAQNKPTVFFAHPNGIDYTAVLSA